MKEFKKNGNHEIVNPHLAEFVTATMKEIAAKWAKHDRRFNITMMENFHINSRLRKKIFMGERINEEQRFNLLRFLLCIEERSQEKIDILFGFYDALNKDFMMRHPDDTQHPFAESSKITWMHVRAELLGAKM